MYLISLISSVEYEKSCRGVRNGLYTYSPKMKRSERHSTYMQMQNVLKGTAMHKSACMIVECGMKG